ncbi:ABC transporter permease [Catellatospora citrea]|uniref:ABC transporter permease n=1 Tax=Catellatospora citrea TaxID=53366 RepID=UPI0033C92E01
MFRLALAGLRLRAGRSLALLGAMMLATTGFIVLTGTSETARLQVKDVVDAQFRPPYDILVRPAGTRTEVEAGRATVMPAFLSGTYGGISLDAWRRIQAVPDVEIAAPVAMVGHLRGVARARVDVTDQVDLAAARQLLRLRPVLRYDRGMSQTAATHDHFAYITTNRLLRLKSVTGDLTGQGTAVYDDGTRRRFRDLFAVCGDPYREAIGIRTAAPPLEVMPDGTRRPICPLREPRGELWAFQRTADGHYLAADPIPEDRFIVEPRFAQPSPRLTVPVPVSTSIMLAAVDPVQESRLVGLDQAMVSGRYLSPGETPVRDDPGVGYEMEQVPAIVTTRPGFDQKLAVAVAALPDEVARLLPGSGADPGVDAPAARHLADLADIDLADVFVEHVSREMIDLNRAETGLPQYVGRPGEPLRPVEVANNHTPPVNYAYFGDTEFRQVRIEWACGECAATVVGQFDPDRLPQADAMARIGVDVYAPVRVEGGDQRSRELLGDGRSLQRSGAAADYVGAPPMLLTSIDLLPTVLRQPPGRIDPDVAFQQAAPISAVRVRIAGIAGFDAVARERTRLVAERIAEATGLDVDIVMGSSPAAQAVDLPPGGNGRPGLRLSEWWSLKGVATAIVTAVDRKSMVLFVLVMVVCALFVGNATWAAVRSRDKELAVLACLGWRSLRLTGLVLSEVAMVGLAAGVLAAGSAVPVAGLAGIAVSWRHALLAIPAALLLALAAAWFPARRAGRVDPMTVVRSGGVRAAGTSRQVRSVTGLAVSNLRRVPGRTVVGAIALAAGVCALTLLVAVTFAFEGAIVGSLMGDAVSVSVRGVDLAAVVGMVLFGLVGVADVQYLNIRDRGAELAVLRSVGWTERALARMVLVEGVGVGVLGAVVGAGLGLGGAALLAGHAPPLLYGIAVAVAVAGIAFAAFAAAVPASGLRRVKLAVLLADE